MKPSLQGTLTIGTLCGLAGTLIGWLVSQSAIGEGYEVFPIFTGLAAFITSAGLWWVMLAKNGKYSFLRGAAAGGLAGILSHYVCWYLLMLSYNLCFWLFGGCRSSLGEPPEDPISALWGAIVLSVGSLLFGGWLTIPIGIAAGGILAARYRRINI
jgi:hypothetical protein